MPIIQRIRPAPSEETAALYIRGVSQAAVANLPADSRLSFNTYFNSFHEAAFVRHCDFGELTYELRLRGDFRLRLLRVPVNGDGDNESDVREIAVLETANCAPEKPVRFPVPSPEGEPGLVHLELTCTRDGGAFLGGHLLASREPERTVELAIVICTYRKEEFVEQTVAALTGDPALREKKIGVYIADNACTLKPEMFPDERVHLLPGKNAGGAGGFTRGLMRAFEGSSATHFLVMDDDVELESESVLRLMTFQEYARENPAVAGAMLSLSEKTRLVTAGSDFDRAQATGDFAPFTVRLLETDADLTSPAVLARLNGKGDFDFGGFWFFAFDREVLGRLAYPLPFFIKGDDAEYGIRTGSMRKLATLPGVCVWHEPPERKPLTWEVYYHYRNTLVIHDLHYQYGLKQSLAPLAKYFLFSLFAFRYNFCELMLRALRDYRRGPAYLGSLDPETVHGEIRALAAKHPAAKHLDVPAESKPAGYGGIAKRIIALFTLGGHAWPAFMGSRRKAPMLERDLKWYSFFPARSYVSRTDFAGDFEYQRRSWTGMLLGARFLVSMTVMLLKRSSLRRRWRESREHLTSAAAWKKYLVLASGDARK